VQVQSHTTYSGPHYNTLHSTTLHYTTLHYTTLHYTTLHYTALFHDALNYTPLRYTTLHYTTLHHPTLLNGCGTRAWPAARPTVQWRPPYGVGSAGMLATTLWDPSTPPRAASSLPSSFMLPCMVTPLLRFVLGHQLLVCVCCFVRLVCRHWLFLLGGCFV